MNLKFWKKKAPTGTEEGETDDDRTVAIPRDAEAAEEEEGTVRPGLFARLRNALSTLRKPRDSGTETHDIEAGTPSREKPAATDRRDADEPVAVPVRNLKKRLIIGGMLGAVVLVLAGIGFTAWTLLAPKHAEQHKPSETTAHNTATAAPKAPDSAAMQAQIEALKKQNAQMHRQLEALKKTGQGETPETVSAESGPTKQANEGVLLFTGKDTKASAAALKQAIEEMNAESSGRPPPKPAP